MPLKMMGSEEPTNEKATIDTDTHHIFMSTTPLAGNKMSSQSLSTDITPGNKSNQSLPLAESTRTPGHQGQTPKNVELLASAKARQLEERTSIALMHELLDEVMQEEQDSIIKELQAAEEARQKALEEAEALKKQQLIMEAQQKAKQEEEERILKEQEEARQKLLQERSKAS